jgi:hypothetical protein
LKKHIGKALGLSCSAFARALDGDRLVKKYGGDAHVQKVLQHQDVAHKGRDGLLKYLCGLEKPST